MQMTVKLAGLDLAQRRLAAVGAQVEPTMRKALNSTATRTRQSQYVQPLAPVFSSRPRLRRGFRIQRAGKKRDEARVIPSSAGVPVTEYANWAYSVIAPTRGRIFVRTLNGRKLAAGFVNPASVARRPLSTRVKGATQRRPRAALGPSLAWFFKQMTNGKTVRWVNATLQQQFEIEIKKVLAK